MGEDVSETITETAIETTVEESPEESSGENIFAEESSEEVSSEEMTEELTEEESTEEIEEETTEFEYGIDFLDLGDVTQIIQILSCRIEGSQVIVKGKLNHKFKTADEKLYLFEEPMYQKDITGSPIADVKKEGAGRNYLIQHSAGSGKSNSIAWTAYRLASLHDSNDESVFSSVVVVTDRTVLDEQLQETISGFDHTIGSVETIDDKKNSKDLRDAINNGARIIVTTLQKFPVIYQEVDKVAGRNFAIIVDEAHSSQTGSSAMKLKAALADTEAALREYAEIEGKAEDEIDRNDKLVQEMLTHGKHPNLSFFAFTATPKPATLEMFGSQWTDGSFHPFHIYSMRQAIEEGFILDVLQNYMTYSTCFKIAKDTPENPELPERQSNKNYKEI